MIWRIFESNSKKNSTEILSQTRDVPWTGFCFNLQHDSVYSNRNQFEGVCWHAQTIARLGKTFNKLTNLRGNHQN